MRLKDRRTRDRIATQIFRERLRRGWTQERLANELGVRRNTVTNLENGTRGPSLEMLGALAEALGTAFVIGGGK